MLTAALRRSLIFAIVIAGTAAAAKEPTRKLIISGGGLVAPIEITDPATLALADIFAENFLDTTRQFAPVPAGLPRYEISFYLSERHSSWFRRWWGRPRLERAYVVYFTPNDLRHESYVYLPGAGDRWAGWNHQVIIRPDREGRWNYAATAWSQRIANAIAHARHA